MQSVHQKTHFSFFFVVLTPIPRKCEPADMYANQTNINYLLLIADLKLYARNESQSESLKESVRIFSDDIGMKSDKLAVSNKLTGENLTQAINSRTVTLVRYARGRIY